MSRFTRTSIEKAGGRSVPLTSAILRSDFAAADDPERHDGTEKRAALLEKKHGGDAQVDSLIERLRACAPDDRCLSSACLVCARAAQRRFSILLEKATRHVQRPEEIFIASIMPASATTPLRRLRGFDPNVVTDAITDACERADIRWAAFAIDFSMNEHRNGRYKPFVMPHVHGVVVTDDVKTLRRELKAAFPATDAIPRPVRVTPWDGDTRAFDYLMKVNLERRIGIDDAVRFDPRTGTNRLCRAVQHDRPRSRERRELLLAFDRIGIDGRLGLVGADLRRIDGRVHIVPRHPSSSE